MLSVWGGYWSEPGIADAVMDVVGRFGREGLEGTARAIRRTCSGFGVRMQFAESAPANCTCNSPKMGVRFGVYGVHPENMLISMK